jgi:hypothetical protein
MWLNSPYFYPAFAEYAELESVTPPEVSDTGVLLRAFLPYSSAQRRETISEYTGKAMVLDSRVACQSPNITNISLGLISSDNFVVVTGVLSMTGTSTPSRLEPFQPTAFDCYLSIWGEISICQLGSSFSIQSQFSNDTLNTTTPSRVGTSFLIIQPPQDISLTSDYQTLEQNQIQFNQNNEWLEVYTTYTPLVSPLGMEHACLSK